LTFFIPKKPVINAINPVSGEIQQQIDRMPKTNDTIGNVWLSFCPALAGGGGADIAEPPGVGGGVHCCCTGVDAADCG
jgi:hypothetical protein